MRSRRGSTIRSSCRSPAWRSRRSPRPTTASCTVRASSPTASCSRPMGLLQLAVGDEARTVQLAVVGLGLRRDRQAGLLQLDLIVEPRLLRMQCGQAFRERPALLRAEPLELAPLLAQAVAAGF